jgi:hypothetical protein
VRSTPPQWLEERIDYSFYSIIFAEQSTRIRSLEGQQDETSLHRSQIFRDLRAMQAQAAESSGYAEQPPPLFELRRVRNREKVAP